MENKELYELKLAVKNIEAANEKNQAFLDESTMQLTKGQEQIKEQIADLEKQLKALPELYAKTDEAYRYNIEHNTILVKALKQQIKEIK